MRRSVGLMGREAELAALRDAQDRWSRGTGSPLVIVGEAGIGKSALLSELTPDAVVLARAWPPPSPAYGPVAALVSEILARGADATVSALGAHAHALEAVQMVSPSHVEAGPPGSHPVMVGDALLRLWATLPTPRPVIVVEDVHWLDVESWAALQRMVERAGRTAAPLLLTSRPDGPNWASLRHLIDASLTRVIRPGPLTGPDIESMVARCLESPPEQVPTELMQWVGAVEGNPLHVEELLGDLIQSGSLRRTDEGWHFDQMQGSVPRSVEALTLSRLEALAPTPRTVVECGAVLGSDLDTALLSRSLELGADELASALRAGASSGLLAVDRSTGRVSFRHELLRDAVNTSLLDVQRRKHASDLLRGLGGPEDDELSEPWFDSLDLDAAVLAARLAEAAVRPSLAGLLHLEVSRRHLRRGAPLAAAASASAIVSGPLDSLLEARALETEALALAGDVHGALEVAGRLEAMLDLDGESGRRADIRRRATEAMARAMAHQGDWEGAATVLSSLGEGMEPGSLPSFAAVVALELGHFEEADLVARAVLALGPPPAAACEVMEVLGRLARRNDLEAAHGWFTRAAELANAEGLQLWRARAAHELATVSQLRTLAVAPLYDARDAALRAGAPGLVTAVDFHIAAVHGVRFEAEESLVAARRLLSEARRLGAKSQEAWAWILIGQAHAVAGQRTQAELAGGEALTCAPDEAEIRGMAAGTCRGLAALLDDDSEAGLGAWVEGIEVLRTLAAVTPLPPWYLWPVLATVTDVEGDGGLRAREETEHGDVRTTPGADGLWHLATSVAEGRRGALESADHHAQQAQRCFEKVPSFDGWRLLGLRHVSADALAAGWGQPGTWMLEATRYFGDRGFTALSSACRQLVRQTGVPQRRSRGTVVPAHLFERGVTSREFDVLVCVAEGLTNAQIAGRLYLSPRTVKGYVEHLLAKTGSANRTKLATWLDAP